MRTITIILGDQLANHDMDTVEMAITEALEEFPELSVTMSVDRPADDDDEADGRSSESTMAGFPMGIARVEYRVETDDQETWYDVLVYTEESLERVKAERIKEHGKDNVNVVRYTRPPV